MNGWMTLWKYLFFFGSGLFALISVWVIIAGLVDIKKMFKALRDNIEDSE